MQQNSSDFPENLMVAFELCQHGTGDGCDAPDMMKTRHSTLHHRQRPSENKKFLEESGFTVVNIRGLGVRSHLDIARLPDYAPYQLARKTVLEKPKTEAIYIPCSQ